MKTRALVGFTWVDAFSWLATEARAQGCAIMVSNTQKRAWLREDQYFVLKDESEIAKSRRQGRRNHNPKKSGGRSVTYGSRFVCWTAIALGVVCSPALAASPSVPKPHCGAIAELKKSGSFTALTPGQFHFAEGIYVASPLTPPGGLPPGDGGLLIDYGNGRAGVVWTHGKTFCITIFVTDAEHHQGAYIPMPVDAKMMEAIKTGVAETAPVADDSADVHL